MVLDVFAEVITQKMSRVAKTTALLRIGSCMTYNNITRIWYIDYAFNCSIIPCFSKVVSLGTEKDLWCGKCRFSCTTAISLVL